MSDYWMHVCQVCHRKIDSHDDRECWPARCCHGCGCGSEVGPERVVNHDPQTCGGGACYDARHGISAGDVRGTEKG